MRFLPRVCFVMLLSLALGAVLSGVGCTHRGTPSVLPSGSPSGPRTIYVNAKTGNDKTGNGSQSTPFKTITHALKVLASPGPVAVSDIEIAAGRYNTVNGEVFPLVVPTGVTIDGAGYGHGFKFGTFVDGVGEDVAYEKMIKSASRTYYAAMEVAGAANGVIMNNLYIGTTTSTLPNTGAVYNALNVLGVGSAATVSIGSMQRIGISLDGVLVPGSFTCTSCSLGGTDYAVATLAVPVTNPSATPAAPTLTLNGPPAQGQGLIGGRVGIKTDGNATITVSNQSFSSTLYAVADTYPALATPSASAASPLPIDLGQSPLSANPSTGGNVFIGSHSEIDVILPGDAVAAFNDTWNPQVQGADKHGRYKVSLRFSPGASGQNVTIGATATGAIVDVGPFQPATPTPSPSPTSSASPTASPTSSP